MGGTQALERLARTSDMYIQERGQHTRRSSPVPYDAKLSRNRRDGHGKNCQSRRDDGDDSEGDDGDDDDDDDCNSGGDSRRNQSPPASSFPQQTNPPPVPAPSLQPNLPQAQPPLISPPPVHPPSPGMPANQPPVTSSNTPSLRPSPATPSQPSPPPQDVQPLTSSDSIAAPSPIDDNLPTVTPNSELPSQSSPEDLRVTSRPQALPSTSSNLTGGSTSITTMTILETAISVANKDARPNLAIIIAATSGGIVLLLICLGLCWFCIRCQRRTRLLRQEQNWKWFDHWRRRHKSMSIITDVEVQASDGRVGQSEKTLLSERNVEKLASRSSVLSTKPALLHHSNSVASKNKGKVRVVSMGGVTNRTGTTSSTNFVVALPPPTHCPLPSPGSSSSHHKVPSLGHYEPTPTADSLAPSQTTDDLLTNAGIRNARVLILSQRE